jgi:branched-chain amino acid transport system permease protein
MDAILSPKGRQIALAVGVLALALVFPHLGFVQNSESVFPIFTVVLCAVYALFSLGLNIVVGFAGLLDLGYVAFFLFGAYVVGWLMSQFFYKRNFEFFGVQPVFDGVKQPGIHLNFFLVAIIAGMIAAVAGVLIGAPTLRLKSDYLALVTLGFGEILFEIFRNGDKLGPGEKKFNLTNGTAGLGPVDAVGTGPLSFLPGFNKTIGPSDYIPKYYVIMFFCALFVFITIRLRDGRLGRAWLAIREDELAASLMGVPLMRTKLWSYAVGAFAGGVGGAFYATIVGTVNVDSFTFQFSMIILCAVILGGMGNVWGALLGGVVITWFNYTGLVFVGSQFNNAPAARLWLYGAVALFAALVGIVWLRSNWAVAKWVGIAALLVALMNITEAANGEALNIIGFVAALAAIAALWIKGTVVNTRTITWMAIVIAAVAAAMVVLALVTKIDSSGVKRLVVGLLLIAAGYGISQFSARLKTAKLLDPGVFTIAAVIGLLVGGFLFRLIRSDFQIDLVKYQIGFFGVVLILMMLFRPEGLIPAARSKAVKKSEQLLEGATA